MRSTLGHHNQLRFISRSWRGWKRTDFLPELDGFQSENFCFWSWNINTIRLEGGLIPFFSRSLPAPARREQLRLDFLNSCHCVGSKFDIMTLNGVAKSITFYFLASSRQFFESRIFHKIKFFNLYCKN